MSAKKFKFEFSRKNLISRATVYLKIYTRYYEGLVWGGTYPPQKKFCTPPSRKPVPTSGPLVNRLLRLALLTSKVCAAAKFLPFPMILCSALMQLIRPLGCFLAKHLC